MGGWVGRRCAYLGLNQAESTGVTKFSYMHVTEALVAYSPVGRYEVATQQPWTLALDRCVFALDRQSILVAGQSQVYAAGDLRHARNEKQQQQQKMNT